MTTEPSYKHSYRVVAVQNKRSLVVPDIEAENAKEAFRLAVPMLLKKSVNGGRIEFRVTNRLDSNDTERGEIVFCGGAP